MPNITVLMTVYNGSQYLRPSLETVLNQTFKDFEFLIIDDCSSDDSASVVRSYQDSRIRLVCNEKNIGQTASLNKGLRLASAPYVARMDADDLAFPDWLKLQDEFIRNNPQYAVVSTQAVVIDQHNRIQKILESCVSPEAVVVKALTASPVNHVGSLMCKDTILSVGGYDERYKIAADYDLWCRLLSRGHKLTSIAETLTAIRFHVRSISIKENKSVMYLELVDVIQSNFERLAGLAIDVDQARLVVAMFYDVANLSDEKFFAAREILTRGYQGLFLIPELKDGSLSMAMDLALRKVDIKKIFQCIKTSTVRPIRRIAKQQINAQGVLNLFSLFWLLSYLGPWSLRNLPAVYERVIKKRALERARDGACLKLG